MKSQLHREFSTYLSSLLLDEIQYQRSNYYYYLSNISNSDSFPIDTESENWNIRNNILFLDKLLPSNVSIGIKKHIWKHNTVYSKWDHMIDMKDRPFYVITSELKIYKCLDCILDTPSTIEPSGNSLYPFKTSDGYTWKYMYSMTEYFYRRFVTSTHIPVRRALSESFYSQGSVSSIIIDESGSGYEDTQLTKIDVSSGGAVLIPQINDVGSIVGVTIVNGGANYTAPPKLTVIVPNGGYPTWSGKFGNTEAKLEAVIYNGEVVHVAIHDPGINYPKLTETQIIIQGDGIGAKAMPIVYQGKIVDAIVTDGGIGYTYIKVSVVGKGTGAKARAVYAQSFVQSDQSDVEQMAIDGAIHSIHINNTGEGYPASTRVIIDGDGVGATAEVIVDQGRIIHFDITNYGRGYTWAVPRLIDYGIGKNIDMYCILPPHGGHGYNAPKELFGDCLIVSASTRDFSHLAISGQQYYQIGLMNGLRNYIGNKTSRSSGQYNVFHVKFSTVENLTIHSILQYSNGHKFRVANIVDTEVWLQPLQKNSIEPVGLLKNQIDQNLQYICTEIKKKPIINIHTGDILCLTDDISFEFSEDQIVTIKTTITF